MWGRPWPAPLGGPCVVRPGAELLPQSRGSTPGAEHAGVGAPPPALLLLLLLPRRSRAQTRRPGAAGRLLLPEQSPLACSPTRPASTATRCSISRPPWVRVSPGRLSSAQAQPCDPGTPTLSSRHRRRPLRRRGPRRPVQPSLRAVRPGTLRRRGGGPAQSVRGHGGRPDSPQELTRSRSLASCLAPCFPAPA